MGMEIFRADVVFFWLLDFYGYGNFPKKCCFFFAIGLLWVWKFSKKMLLFFGYWTSIGMEIFQKNVFFLAIGLIWVWKFSKKMLFFLAIRLIWVWKFSKKMLLFFGY